MKKFISIVLLSMVILSCHPKKPKEPTKTVGPQTLDISCHYLKIIEINTDTLPFSSDHEAQSTPIPFFLKNAELYIDKKNTPKDKDISKAKLLIEYVVQFQGKARKFDIKEYFIFNELPSELKLKSYDKTRKEVTLSLLDPLVSLENIRYLPPKIVLKEEEFKLGGKREIYSFSQKLNVKKEVLEPISKGQKMDSDQIKTKVINFGEVYFSTKIHIEYVGHFKKATVF